MTTYVYHIKYNYHIDLRIVNFSIKLNNSTYRKLHIFDKEDKCKLHIDLSYL